MEAHENMHAKKPTDNDDKVRDSESMGRPMLMVLLDGGVPFIAELDGRGPWEVPLALGSRCEFEDGGEPAAKVQWDAQNRRITASIVGGDLMSTGFDIRRVGIDEAGALRNVVERARVLGIACDIVAAVWRRENDERWTRDVALNEADEIVVNVIVSGSVHKLDLMRDELAPHWRRALTAALKPKGLLPFRHPHAGGRS